MICDRFEQAWIDGESQTSAHWFMMSMAKSVHAYSLNGCKTQIMNLALLAPDIQEALLCLPREFVGRSKINEKMLRPMTAKMDWNRQREIWRGLQTDDSQTPDE